MNKDLLNYLNNTKTKLKKVRSIINIKNKALNRLRFYINDNIYRLGDYCCKYLCTDKFKHSLVFRSIQDIEAHQKAYDKLAKEVATYRDLEIILIDEVDMLCKRLGIENV